MANYFFDFSVHSDYNKNPFFDQLLRASAKNEVVLYCVDGHLEGLIDTLNINIDEQKVFNVSSSERRDQGIFYTETAKFQQKVPTPLFYIDTNFSTGHDTIKKIGKTGVEVGVLLSYELLAGDFLNYISRNDTVYLNCGTMLECSEQVLNNLGRAFTNFESIFKTIRENRSAINHLKDYYLVLSLDKSISTPKMIKIDDFKFVSSEELRITPPRSKSESSTKNYPITDIQVSEALNEYIKQEFQQVKQELQEIKEAQNYTAEETDALDLFRE